MPPPTTPHFLAEEIVVLPKRYDGNYILKNFKELREKRESKLTPGRAVLFIVPLEIYEGEIIERLPGGNLMVRLKDPAAAIQTTGEYLVPLSTD